ncbi:excinuclease ABC subunit UvrA [Thioalkalivibrio denitrificans]|uniref:excinuclease ABC subunit UvrA n=1 Tax=Thioalkalivibrio denitrificans TaxID=108003 RepID=UPI00158D7198|nr:excinuclease ABC subunit UvrA [Thioalkalivibrio denitrificans]
MSQDRIRIFGARQNNLKGLDLELPLNELIVVTGVSGSGKSSLAFDTVYAEGQRRYVETFSPYARQFLDRMDKPAVDRIEGVLPAIAIDQTNPVRTSRSTVGTMTELNDHLKLLYARAAHLHCRGCGAPVRRDSPESIADEWLTRKESGAGRVMVVFAVPVPENFSAQEVKGHLRAQGYERLHVDTGTRLEVIQDRLRVEPGNRGRLVEALETALHHGQGRVRVYPLGEDREPLAPMDYSADLHCAACDLHYSEPTSNHFSFNSPIGACEACRGFGRTMGIDLDLVIPDGRMSLGDGAVKPWQTDAYYECQAELKVFARKRGIPLDVPWDDLSDEQQAWVIEGEGDFDDGVWYGIRRFFDWLETKSYKMHIRVLLSRYRSYEPCKVCQGARLKPDSLLWRLGTKADADGVLQPGARFLPAGVSWSRPRLESQPGLCLHDLMQVPLARCKAFFDHLHLPKPLDEATDLLLAEIRARLNYLCEVGLGYLTLDRQSRTLSGGEVQRINLTTALGTSLVNTLFVLDEPSIGLHPRDMDRVVGVLRRLRDAGNSLLVVEHDPQVMRAADRILDMGPGPGERGGEVVFFGTPAQILRSRQSLTGQYLSGRKQVALPSAGLPPDRDTVWLELHGAVQHNLKGIDARFPLGRLVCVTGVSGSGKSTLIQNLLYPALAKLKGRPEYPAGAFGSLSGHESLDAVVMVDQSPIGRTARSCPASYVGAFDAIRKLFAEEPLAKERGYTAGTFSFNSGNGRCPVCTGSGFEYVEMQFLSDVYLRCGECDGRRYRPEVLQVKALGAEGHAADLSGVLEMTVTEALAFFAHVPEIQQSLEPLAAVGLEYLRLGQPVPTLSGGEAQRLKLAGHLVRHTGRTVGRACSAHPCASPQGGSRDESLPAIRSARQQSVPEPNGRRAKARPAERGATLFLLDEPTTGLHFEDIARLLKALRRLQAEGHSLIVIEHNLDVIRAADWLLDLGPEGGDGGGEIVCEGTPAQVMDHPGSHTGAALRAEAAGGISESSAPSYRKAAKNVPAEIRISNAREHNLKGVDIQVPRDRFTVVTGVSGSGKSTVAFDILFNEGQRRYLESLNAYARSLVQPASRPEVDAVTGIPPTVAIEQRTSRGGHKSTVGTLTEVHHFLRLLYVKLGTQYCPDCDVPIEPQTPEAILAALLKQWKDREVHVLAPLVSARKGYYTDLARWARNRGFSHLRVDGELIPTDPWPRLDRYREHDIELPVASLRVTPKAEAALREAIARGLDLGKGMIRVAPVNGRGRSPHPGPLPRAGEGDEKVSLHDGRAKGRAEKLYSTERACPSCARSFDVPDPRLFSYNARHGWCRTCFGTGVVLKGFDEAHSGEEGEWLEEGESRQTCPACHGQRLRPEALAVRFRERSIGELSALPVKAARAWFEKLKPKARESAIARDILPEIRGRLAFLEQVGLGYLSLDRGAPTLSGGEAQRIRLAAQLGTNLQGVCYILDEPTIGLHPRDNRMLLDTLHRLQAKGNTVVVVEHDEDTIRSAEHVIDLGPGAGERGGRLVAQGSVKQVMKAPESLTGRFLAHPLLHPLVARRPTKAGQAPALTIEGACLNNLRIAAVSIPLNRLVCVTGVSGSGKSTLVREVLYRNLAERVGKRGRKPALTGCAALEGWQDLERVLEVDQTPIGRTPRSCPATYVGVFDRIRKLYAETPEARLRGWNASRFSFNTSGGRCAVCEGQGVRRIEMSFLPDVVVPCEACGGGRYARETLEARFKDRSIADVLNMSVDEAVPFFIAHPAVHQALRLLQDVGLGYLRLGQPSPTLSGGEAQRMKLVTELSRSISTFARSADQARPTVRSSSRTGSRGSLYVLDEPTVGLHMADVEKLIRVLHRLVEAGHSVIVIEHNLDVIAEADWIIDMGPEGGDRGGRVAGQGAPEVIARRRSHTGRMLRGFIAGPGGRPVDHTRSADADGNRNRSQRESLQR